MHANLVTVALGALILLGFVLFGLRFVYGYRIEDRDVAIVLFHVLPLYRIPFDNIEEIRKASLPELATGGFAMRLGNRLTWQGVLIVKRSGWPRRTVITPSDPDAFVRLVEAGLRSQPRPSPVPRQ
jgi:hypothetical protein